MHSVTSRVCRASCALYFVGTKTSMYLESIRCSSQHIRCFFLLKDARRSWLRTYNRAPLHRAARTSDIAPAIFGYSMKQLQTFPHSPEKWWKHIFAHYALRKAIKHLTYLLSKADLDSVMILLHERKVSTASNRSNSKLIYQVPQCRLNGTVFPSIQFE